MVFANAENVNAHKRENMFIPEPNVRIVPHAPLDAQNSKHAPDVGISKQVKSLRILNVLKGADNTK